jgi:hypothetical protein
MQIPSKLKTLIIKIGLTYGYLPSDGDDAGSSDGDNERSSGGLLERQQARREKVVGDCELGVRERE